ncbi:MAG: HEAT repeat domain-containing protein [Myxococcales bacterium]|nr:HEAT repeat domain-containing protein [Myxococcales bacterium]
MVRPELLKLLEMEDFHWPENAEAIILRGLADQALENRSLAVQLTSGAVTDSIARQLVRLAREDGDHDLRCDALGALGDALQNFVFDDTGGLGGLSDDGEEWLDGELQTIFRDPTTPEPVRVAALCAASRSTKEWIDDELRRAYQTGDERWMVAALDGMSYREDFDAQVLAALDHDSPSVRVAAIDACAVAQVEASLPRLIRFARDETLDPMQRVAAVAALGLFDTPEIEAVLEQLRRDPNVEIADVAAVALQELEITRSMAHEEDE